MPERERQRAAGADVQLLVVSEQKKAVLHVQVRVADAAALNPDEELRAVWLWTFDNGFAQRLGISIERLAAKLGHE